MSAADGNTAQSSAAANDKGEVFMKKNTRRILSICLVLVMLICAFPVSALAASSGKLGSKHTWSLNSSGVLTVSGSGEMPNFQADIDSIASIPWIGYYSSIKSVVIREGVESVGSYAFYGHSSISRVSLPRSLRSIGTASFYSCSSLSSIELPSKLTSIGSNAFDFCPISSVKIPASVSSISTNAFALCGMDAKKSRVLIKEFSVDSANKKYSSVNGVLYNKDRTELIRCPMTKKGAFAVPASVKRIGQDAFFGCIYLTSVTLPASVTSIEPYAFEYCEALQNITLPEGITAIREGVFNNCTALQNITVPKSVESIEAYAFYCCEALRSVIAHGSLKKIASSAFDECTSFGDLFFAGSEESYAAIDEGEGGRFKSAAVHFDFTLPTRLAGSGRCETAAEISKAGFESAENVVLASGNDYADALAGVPLAYALDAPVLLIRNHELDSATLSEINRLGVKNVYILGGDFAINGGVESALKNKGYNVSRLAGDDRFGTSVKIAEKLFELAGAPDELFFTYSHNYPDALAISGIAASKGCPVLYIAGSGNLTDETSDYISSSDAPKATIISGPAIVGSAAEENIENSGVDSVKRIYGSDRYETCLKINRQYKDTFSGEAICVATGTNYPDALAGGVFAAANGAPLLLVGDNLTNAQKNYLSELPPTDAYIFGGTGAVGENIVHDLLLIDNRK